MMKMKGELNVMLIVAVIGILIIAGGIFGAVTGFFKFMGQTEKDIVQKELIVPTNTLKVGLVQYTLDEGDDVSADDLRQTATALVEMSERKPYEKAVSPDRKIVTEEQVNQLYELVNSGGVDTKPFFNLYTQCQGWLTTVNPGKTDFEADKGTVNYYYDSLIEDHALSTMDPTAMSEDLWEKDSFFATFCETGCENLKTCRDCWEMVRDFKDAYEAGDDEEFRSVMSEMESRGCGSACAGVCEAMYPDLKLLFVESVANPDARKAFISKGIKLT